MSSPRRLPSIPLVRKMIRRMDSESTGDNSADSIAEMANLSVIDENVPSIEYKIPMAPFERFLLQNTAETWSLDIDSFGGEDADPTLMQYLFNQWDWSYDTQALLCEGFAQPNEANKTREQIYDEALFNLERLTALHLQRRYRGNQLRSENNDFVSNLRDLPFSQVKFVPSEGDEHYWKILVAMYRDCPEEMEFWTNAITRRITYRTTLSSWKTWFLQYEIWKVVKMFNLKKRRPNNAEELVELFTRSNLAPICMASLRLKVPGLDYAEDNENSRSVEYRREAPVGDPDEMQGPAEQDTVCGLDCAA